jgi:ribosome-associated protein
MVDLDYSLNELLKNCEVRRSCGSGPGGQHRNRTASRINLLHIPSNLRVSCDDTRSQHRNLKIALLILQNKLQALNRVDPVRIVRRKRLRRVKERILSNKRYNSNRKRLRQKPTAD